jgi:hypothetical protein
MPKVELLMQPPWEAVTASPEPPVISRLEEDYREFEPPVPGGRGFEVQVMAAEFVRGHYLWWREDAANWWQLCQQVVDAATDAVGSGWIERTENEVRAFVFGYLAGCSVQGGRAARSRLADNVLREAKLLAWPQGACRRNDLTSWARRNVRLADFNVGDVTSDELIARFVSQNPEIGNRRKQLEMQLAGAMKEAWAHEDSVKSTNCLIRDGKRRRGWVGLVLVSR